MSRKEEEGDDSSEDEAKQHRPSLQAGKGKDKRGKGAPAPPHENSLARNTSTLAAGREESKAAGEDLHALQEGSGVKGQHEADDEGAELVGATTCPITYGALIARLGDMNISTEMLRREKHEDSKVVGAGLGDVLQQLMARSSAETCAGVGTGAGTGNWLYAYAAPIRVRHPVVTDGATDEQAVWSAQEIDQWVVVKVGRSGSLKNRMYGQEIVRHNRYAGKHDGFPVRVLSRKRGIGDSAQVARLVETNTDENRDLLFVARVAASDAAEGAIRVALGWPVGALLPVTNKICGGKDIRGWGGLLRKDGEKTSFGPTEFVLCQRKTFNCIKEAFHAGKLGTTLEQLFDAVKQAAGWNDIPISRHVSLKLFRPPQQPECVSAMFRPPPGLTGKVGLVFHSNKEYPVFTFSWKGDGHLYDKKEEYGAHYGLRARTYNHSSERAWSPPRRGRRKHGLTSDPASLSLDPVCMQLVLVM